jgi:hypothetical protein
LEIAGSIIEGNMDEAADLTNRDYQKAEAILMAEDAISEIELKNRQPDAWERVHLVEAISDIFCGRYLLGMANADMASTPSTERCERGLPTDGVYARYDLALLREALHVAQASPVLRFAQF